MKNGYNIERLINLLSCSHCGTRFDESCIGLLEVSYDTVMVRIVCKECGKKYVLAFMDLNFSFFEASFGAPSVIESFSECNKKDTEQNNDILNGEEVFFDKFYFEDKKENSKCLDKITYDDVLEAHEFIQNFEENWRRYLDKRQYKIT